LSSAGGLFVAGSSAAVTFDVKFEDGRMVDKAINGDNGHARIREDAVPPGEWLVGGIEQTAVFIAFGNQFKQHARFGLVLGSVGNVVEDDQVERSSLANADGSRNV
jgi:hypothetical protein